eukprot:Gb_22194 [translate_table: standard]
MPNRCKFETPMPPLQPAVYPPRLREPSAPALELFDLDECFAPTLVRLNWLTNKMLKRHMKHIQLPHHDIKLNVWIPQVIYVLCRWRWTNLPALLEWTGRKYNMSVGSANLKKQEAKFLGIIKAKLMMEEDSMCLFGAEIGTDSHWGSRPLYTEDSAAETTHVAAKGTKDQKIFIDGFTDLHMQQNPKTYQHGLGILEPSGSSQIGFGLP